MLKWFERRNVKRPWAITIVFLILGVAVVAAVAMLAVGRLGELPDSEPDRPPVLLPDDRLVASQDVDDVRFAVGMRGYRMDEVDAVIEGLRAENARLRGQGSGRPDPGARTGG